MSGIFEKALSNSHAVFPSAAKQYCNMCGFFVQSTDVTSTPFFSIYHKVSKYTCSRYTCHCNFINTIRKVRTEFPAVILAENTRAHQHYMQVSCRDFHQNPSINGSSLTPVSQVFLAFTVSTTTKSIRFLWLSNETVQNISQVL